MIKEILKSKPTILFISLAGFFITNTIVAEVIGVKIFSLEDTLGINKFAFTLFGEKNLSLDLTVGVLPWPFVFIFTDIINEYYGVKGVRFLSFLTAILIVFVFIVFYFAIHTSPALWWDLSQSNSITTKNSVPNMQNAFAQILGQGMSIIFASITAFIIGQLLDAFIFKAIKKKMGDNNIWFRATASTLFSQLIDTIIVSYIYLYFALGFSFPKVTAIAIVGYSYKFLAALFFSPLIYVVRFFIEKYLGNKVANQMKQDALFD